jgi:CotH kinase protein/Putative metal-binding motif
MRPAALLAVLLAAGCVDEGVLPPSDDPDHPDAAVPHRPDARVPGASDPDAAPSSQPPPDAAPVIVDPPAPPLGSYGALGDCSSIFEQSRLTDYHLEIEPTEWAALTDEFLRRAERLAAGLEEHPWHPVRFRAEDDAEIPDVLIRLKGNSSWAETIALDANPKMQFVVAFNEIDDDGRYYGVRKLDFDMPRDDRSFLRQRLALYYLRGLGVPAQCAASARIYVNGEYYGLYTAVERLDKEFLQREFGHDDDGDLFEAGWEIKTNEDHWNWQRYNTFFATTTADEIAAMSDLEASLLVWAGEAMLPDVDGYWAGRPNFYLYDHPQRGYLWIPNDLDSSFDFFDFAAPATLFPIFPHRTLGGRYHGNIVLADPTWAARYVAALRQAWTAYDVAALRQRVDQWSAQIRASAQADPHRSFTPDQHVAAVSHLRASLQGRRSYIDAWLTCRETGTGIDADFDGVIACYDCDDDSAAISPLALESANALDDNCNGQVDEGFAPPPPEPQPPPP